MTAEVETLKRRIRWLLGLFVVALLVSGLTAVPLRAEAGLLDSILGEGSSFESIWPQMARWISLVNRGITETNERYPFMLYGTDWLAFAHVVIAIAFIGPVRDPVKNVWVIEFGMIACILVVPVALICGAIRDIPFFWRLIDCSFGILGVIPLYIARKYTRRLLRSRVQ